MNEKYQVIFLFLTVFSVSFLFFIYGVLTLDGLEKDIQNRYDEARNNTLNQITPNMSIADKFTIITINCQREISDGWRSYCIQNLSEELIK